MKLLFVDHSKLHYSVETATLRLETQTFPSSGDPQSLKLANAYRERSTRSVGKS